MRRFLLALLFISGSVFAQDPPPPNVLTLDTLSSVDYLSCLMDTGTGQTPYYNSCFITATGFKNSVAVIGKSALSVATSGSGAATYNSLTGVINVPATVSSVGITSSTLTVSGSPVTSTGNISLSLPSVGSAGTYDRVTTDAQGRVTSGTTASISNGVSRTLSTCFQVSASRLAYVEYGIDTTGSLTLSAGPKGSAFLRTYTNSSCTTGQQTVFAGSSGSPAVLAVAVGLQNLGTIVLPGWIAAGLWVQLETQVNTGTVTFSLRPENQETLF